MSNDVGHRYRDRLVEILKEHPEGLTIEELSKITTSHRQTVTKYLSWLEGADLVFMRRIGAVTLCYLKKDWERLRK